MEPWVRMVKSMAACVLFLNRSKRNVTYAVFYSELGFPGKRQVEFDVFVLGKIVLPVCWTLAFFFFRCRAKNAFGYRELSLKDLSQMVGMSPVAFSRFFKLRTGKTLSDYIIDIRLGYASRMLVDSNKTISEICFECGFNNLSNFNRIFKKKRNMTPKLFRAHYRKNKSTI